MIHCLQYNHDFHQSYVTYIYVTYIYVTYIYVTYIYLLTSKSNAFLRFGSRVSYEGPMLGTWYE